MFGCCLLCRTLQVLQVYVVWSLCICSPAIPLILIHSSQLDVCNQLRFRVQIKHFKIVCVFWFIEQVDDGGAVCSMAAVWVGRPMIWTENEPENMGRYAHSVLAHQQTGNGIKLVIQQRSQSPKETQPKVCTFLLTIHQRLIACQVLPCQLLQLFLTYLESHSFTPTPDKKNGQKLISLKSVLLMWSQTEHFWRFTREIMFKAYRARQDAFYWRGLSDLTERRRKESYSGLVPKSRHS